MTFVFLWISTQAQELQSSRNASRTDFSSQLPQLSSLESYSCILNSMASLAFFTCLGSCDGVQLGVIL